MPTPIKRNSLCIVPLFCALLLASMLNIAHADIYSDENYCEYYDYNGGFTVSFDKNIPLGPSAPSTSQGIEFIFDKNTTVRIYSSFSNYDPGYSEPDLPDDIVFVNDHKLNGCSVLPIQFNGIKVICKNYEYSIIPMQRTAQPYADMYLYIQYNFINNKYHKQYQKKFDSLLIFFSPDLERFNALIKNIAYSFDPDDPFKQPQYVCGKDRIRQKMLSNHSFSK